MSVVAIIPARAGSKRIPGKNTRPFLGRPIIAYSIEAARAAGLFERIVPSSPSGLPIWKQPPSMRAKARAAPLEP